jgi:hypothetical protein
MQIELTSIEKEHWEDYLEDFKNLVYEPVFKKHGFTLPEATIIWWLNRVNNNTCAILDIAENKNA